MYQEILSQGQYFPIHSLWSRECIGKYCLCIISFDIIPVAREYQDVHPYSAMNIDSVIINSSLIMMREWVVQGVFFTGPPPESSKYRQVDLGEVRCI